MKPVKRVAAIVLAATISMSAMQSGALAVEAAEQTAWQQTAVQQTAVQFTGFVHAGQQIGEVPFVLGQDIVSLTAQMPQALSVILADGTTMDIPVSWICLGDYANTDDFYYQFVPQWDMTAYSPAGVLDSATGVPYVVAQRTDSAQTAPEDGVMQSQQNANKNASTIFSFLIKNCNFHAAAACGILANIECESDFNPTCRGDSGTSYGICQWHNERLTAMQNWCAGHGYNWKELTGQLYYLRQELSGNTNRYLYNGLTIANKLRAKANTAKGAFDAGYDWCYYYEVPANRGARSAERGNKARNSYWPKFSNKTVTEDPTPGDSHKPVYNVFSDIRKGAWYCSAVQFVYDKGIMNGTGDGRFSPNDRLSRAMVATLLNNLSRSRCGCTVNSPANARFSDVPAGAWYATPVRWAVSAGILGGSSNGKFNPSGVITREQFATALYHYAKKLGRNVSASASLDRFSDSANVSSGARAAMQWAVAKKIVNGTDQKMLNPKGSLTRAEAAQMIKSFVSAVA